MKELSKARKGAVLISLAFLVFGIAVAHKVIEDRKQAASVALHEIERLSLQGDWKAAFALTSSAYKALANEVNFRGDFGFWTNGAAQFLPAIKLTGGFGIVEIRRSFSADATSGLVFELVPEDDRWAINSPPARWTSTDW